MSNLHILAWDFDSVDYAVNRFLRWTSRRRNRQPPMSWEDSNPVGVVASRALYRGPRGISNYAIGNAQSRASSSFQACCRNRCRYSVVNSVLHASCKSGVRFSEQKRPFPSFVPRHAMQSRPASFMNHLYDAALQMPGRQSGQGLADHG